MCQCELVQILLIVRKLEKSKILVDATIWIIGFLNHFREVYHWVCGDRAILSGVILIQDVTNSGIEVKVTLGSIQVQNSELSIFD